MKSLPDILWTSYQPKSVLCRSKKVLMEIITQIVVKVTMLKIPWVRVEKYPMKILVSTSYFRSDSEQEGWWWSHWNITIELKELFYSRMGHRSCPS